MILVDGEKYACQQCIRGHRSSTCKHIKRPLVLVRSRGRPLTDSFQRIAILAEEIKDENEREKILKNEKNPNKNLLAATRSETIKLESFCCNKNINKVDNDDYDTVNYNLQSDHLNHQENVIQPSCCSNKISETKIKIESKCNSDSGNINNNNDNKDNHNNKTICQCCPDSSLSGCKKSHGPVYVLKAAKRQVYNVEKDSLRLLDPVVEIPNSKVGLDIIQKVSKNKKLKSFKNKQIKEEVLNSIGVTNEHIPSASCCTNKFESKIKQLNLNKDKVNSPFVYQFQVAMNKKNKFQNGKSKINRSCFTQSSCKQEKIALANKNDSDLSNVKLENNLNSHILEFNNNTDVSNTNTIASNNLVQNYDIAPDRQTVPNSIPPEISNGLLYDLFIADSCTVPGSCSCEPDKCACPDCTEHSKYRNSNLTVKQQFEEFQFPTNDTPIPNDSNLNKSIHGIRPCGKVEMQSSIPLFEQSFLKILNNQNEVNSSSEQIQLYSDTTSQNSNMEECCCEPDQCYCYNCIQHGIIGGVRISDGVYITERESTPQEIQMLASQFPLYGVSPSSSEQSTPTVMSESDDFLKNPTNAIAMAARASSYNNFSKAPNNNNNNNNNKFNRENSNDNQTSSEMGNSNDEKMKNYPINLPDKELWMRYHSTNLYPSQNQIYSENMSKNNSEYRTYSVSTNASATNNMISLSESINSQDELISRILSNTENNFHEAFQVNGNNNIDFNIPNGHKKNNLNMNGEIAFSDNLNMNKNMNCVGLHCQKNNCDGNCQQINDQT